MRYYGFDVDEIAAGGEDGMLDLDVDPKLAWALKHRERFPVDVNRADREMLLRVPGLGARAVDASSRRAGTRPCASTTSRASPRASSARARS